MLYTGLQFCSRVAVFLSIYATQHTWSVDDVVYASGSCAQTTSSDTCTMYCDDSKSAKDFDCGSASICTIHCTKDQCFDSSTITASNVGKLYIDVDDVKDCFRDSIIYLPNSADAIFEIVGTSTSRAYRRMTIESGNNTNIYMNCGQTDACENMIVNAADAEYLEIFIGTATLGAGLSSYGIINCPNGNYNGPEISSCIIDARDMIGGGTLEDLTITAQDGIPNDFWIKGNPTIFSVTIICPGAGLGYSDNLDWDNVQSNRCYSTNAPSFNPTLPTTTPTTTIPTTMTPTTNSPSINPTTVTPTTSTPTNSAPTTTPTVTPTTITLFPTNIPTTITPTNIPSITPTLIPSISPITNAPTDELTYHPTMSPITPKPTLISAQTYPPTKIPTFITTFDGEDQTEDKAHSGLNANDTGFFNNDSNVIIMVLGILVFVLLLAVGWFVYRNVETKKQNHKTNTTKIISNSNLMHIVDSDVNNDDEGGMKDGANQKVEMMSIKNMDVNTQLVQEGMSGEEDDDLYVVPPNIATKGNDDNQDDLDVMKGNVTNKWSDNESSISKSSQIEIIAGKETTKGNANIVNITTNDSEEDMYVVQPITNNGDV
eukprot:362688_1